MRAIALVRAGKTVTAVAALLEISQSCLHNWVKQDDIDRGQRQGLSTIEHLELAGAKRRIRQLETELEIVKQASKLFEAQVPRPKGFTR